MKQVVVFTGAGISAESGLKTFRDGDGLWRQYRYEDVASPEAWAKMPNKVLEFYNERRRQLASVLPNAAHRALKKLETKFIVNIITQNVDDLHERSGSTNVMHLHGELTKARSDVNPRHVVEIGYSDIAITDHCADGSKMRPHIVWFGEAVEMMTPAIKEISRADMIIIIGTSLQVYPAAGLIQYARADTPIFYIDPKAKPISGINCKVLASTATEGVPRLVEELLNSMD